MKTYKKSRSWFHVRGFTLTELMVAIVIVVVLVAMSFMFVKKARDKATAAVDANDLRSIYQAIHLYTQDENGDLPTTSGGVSPTYRASSRDLVPPLAPYLGRENLKVGDFLSEFAAASWQKSTKGANGPSLLVMHRVYSGSGKPDSQSRPSPNFTPFGYPYGDGRRSPMTMRAAMSKMGNPSFCLMITEIDRLHPNFRGSTPGWLDLVPEGMAHGNFRLGLYWDGHVARLDEDLNPK